MKSPSVLRALVALSNRAHLDQRGQSTAEYALVLVAIAALVGVVISFMSGSGGGLISGLFSGVLGKIGHMIGIG